MVAGYPKIRLYIDAPLHPGAVTPLTEGQAHYALQVMRMQKGEPIALFNGRDGEWRATLEPSSKKRADCRVETLLREQVHSPDMWYVFAPLKHGRIDYIAQKTAELGASALVPVITRRTIASRVNEERLHANAIEAAEQCERLDVPAVHSPQPLDRLLAQWPQERLLLYGDETGHGEPPSLLFPTLPDTITQWAVLVGPEGGFAPEELTMLRSCPFARGLSMGPRILRADTAGLAALSCLQAWRGDWNHKPAFRYSGE